MIEILLPVYNGEKYLQEQLDSIIKQTNQNWILKIRNDGSTDNSQKIIDKYCKEYPDKVFNIKSPECNIGLVNSLNYLKNAEPKGDYIMFSDQDDIWLPSKIDLSLAEVKQLENKNKNVPVMICTDAKCVDQSLNILEESFFCSQKFPKDIMGNINKMAALNVIQGCTIMINRAASSHIFPMPLIMTIHDMWIGLNCAYFGKVKYIYTPTILYRQHSSNVAGSIKINSEYYLKRLTKITDTLTFLLKLKKYLKFNISLGKIIYFKLKFMINRL